MVQDRAGIANGFADHDVLGLQCLVHAMTHVVSGNRATLAEARPDMDEAVNTLGARRLQRKQALLDLLLERRCRSVPPRQNSCRLYRSTTQGAALKDGPGSIRTGPAGVRSLPSPPPPSISSALSSRPALIKSALPGRLWNRRSSAAEPASPHRPAWRARNRPPHPQRPGARR